MNSVIRFFRRFAILPMLYCGVQVFPGYQDTEIIYEGSDNLLVTAARKFVLYPFRYDFSMKYYVTTYRDSLDRGKAIYPDGDIDPTIGVCTDLIVRSYRRIGYDLQKMVHEDALTNFSAYPYAIWGLKTPDPNIDHRRVPMLNSFFKRLGTTLSIETSGQKLSEWKSGDIVIWDLTGRGKPDHIGIIADARLKESNRPLVIHNYPDPGYVAMEDVLNTWTIKAHYRFPK